MPLEGEEGLYKLPNEILLKIFQHFTENYLCRVSEVCKRFWKIANDKLLWKPLYHKVYEYDQPLMLKLGKFEFISESEYENPWKKSFMQLYPGVHVRPGFKEVTSERDKDRNLQVFDTISDAMDCVKEKKRNLSLKKKKLTQHFVFIHAGSYNLDHIDKKYGITIESDNIMLIGAASGLNIAKSVIIKRQTNIIYVGKKLRCVYVGYLTLEITSSNSLEAHCLIILSNPTIDHCIIRSFNCKCAAVFVNGDASPLVKNCDISNCASDGLYIGFVSDGTYQDNVISYNADAGILINRSSEKLIVCRNNIHQNNHSNRSAGIYILSGKGCIKDNEVYNNGIGFIITSMSSKVTIQKNKIFNEKDQDYTQSIGVSFRDYAYGKLIENDIYNHSTFGVEISKGCDPEMRSNTIRDNAIDIFRHTQ